MANKNTNRGVQVPQYEQNMNDISRLICNHSPFGYKGFLQDTSGTGWGSPGENGKSGWRSSSENPVTSSLSWGRGEGGEWGHRPAGTPGPARAASREGALSAFPAGSGRIHNQLAKVGDSREGKGAGPRTLAKPSSSKPPEGRSPASCSRLARPQRWLLPGMPSTAPQP
jgi:hypothetical protein